MVSLLKDWRCNKVKNIILGIFIGVLIGEIVYDFFFKGEFSLFHILFLTIAISFGFYFARLINSYRL